MSFSNPFIKKMQQSATASIFKLRMKMLAQRVFFIFLVAALGTFGLLGTVGVARAALLGGPTITPGTVTKSDVIIDDGVPLSEAADGKADPGEHIEYTVTIPNAGTVPGTDDALNLTFNDTVDPNTVFVPGSLVVSPLALDDATYQTVGNMTLDSSAINATCGGNPLRSVTCNDLFNGATLTGFGDTQGNAASIVVNGSNTVTTIHSGTVTLNTDGTFTYNPAAGYEGSDEFWYTLTNSSTSPAFTDNAKATFNVGGANGMVWFVSSAGGGTGRQTNPFTLAAFNTANTGVGSNPAAGDTVFLFEGAHTGPVTLLANQKFIGQDATVSVPTLGGPAAQLGNAYPAINPTGTTVSITSAGVGITLASGNNLAGFTSGNATTAITGTVAGTLSVRDVTINTNGQGLIIGTSGTLANTATFTGFTGITTTGGVNGISLTGVGGTLNTGGALSGASGNTFNVSGGTANITYTGTIASGSAHSVNVAGKTGGTVTFSGAITDTDTGVSLTANTGATIDFTGGLSLSTGASPAFTATGGGTVSVTGATNTLTTTTGTALNVVNTTIGASDLTFLSINSTSASANPGIVLNATGSSGGLTVTGTGTTAGTGGTISTKTGNGMTLTNTSNVTLKNMILTGNGTSQTVAGSATTCGGGLRTGDNLSCVANLFLRDSNNIVLNKVTVSNSGQMGINGNNVDTFTMSNSTITGNGNESFENGLTFQNLKGTCSITDSMIKDNAAYQINVTNIASSSTLTLNITGTRTNNVYPTMDTSTTEIGKTTQTNTFTDQSLLFDAGLSTPTNVNMTLNITGVAFKNSLPGNSVLINPGSASGTFGGTTTDSSFDNTAGGVIIQAQNGMNGIYNVRNSEFNRVNLQSILYGAANPYNGAFSGSATDNHIGEDETGTAGAACEPAAGNCHGIDVNFVGGSGSISTLIKNNVIQQFAGTGILVTANGSGSPDVNVNIFSNTIKNPLGFIAHGIQTNMGTTSGANVNGCLGIGGAGVLKNDISGTYEDPGVGTQFGIVTNVRFLSHHRLPSYGGSSTAVGGPGSAVTDFIIANNTTSSKVFTQRGGSGDYPGGAACSTPLAMLPNNTHVVVQIQPETAPMVAAQALSVNSAAAKTFTTAAVSGAAKLSKQAAWAKASSVALLTSNLNTGTDHLVSAVQPAPAYSPDVTVGPLTLPANKTLRIRFRVVVKNPIDSPVGAIKIENQGNVTFTGGPGGGVDTNNSGTVDCESGSVPKKTCTPVDRPDATLLSINRQPVSSGITNAASVKWRVTFNTAVSGLTSSNFTLTDVSNSITGEGITGVSAVTGSPDTQWDVTASTGTTGDGTLRLDMTNDTSLSHDVFTLPFTTGETYTIDKTAPTVSSIVRKPGSNNPTNADILGFRVTFSEAVTGVDGSNFVTTGTTSSINDALTTNITPNLVFELFVDGTAGGNLPGLNGTVGLDVTPTTITDLAGNALVAAEPPAPASTNDQTYTVDNTAPTVTINQAGAQADPTNGSPINFTVTFSEAVTGFVTGDVDLSAGTAPGTLTGTVTGGPTIYNVAVSGMTGDGTVIASIAASKAQDLAGNDNTASTSTDDTVTYDATAPTVTINQAGVQVDPTNTSPINFTVTFSEAVTGFVTGDVTLSASTAPGTLTGTVSGGPTVYNVAVSGMTGDGTVIASILANKAQDLAGNNNAASTSTDNTVTYDATAPTVTINQAGSQADPTASSPINFTVTFSEAVTGFVTGDVDLSASTASGTLTGTVSGGPTIYNVAVSGMTGDGNVIASILANKAQDLAGNNNAASTSTDNSVLYDTVPPSVTINQAGAQADPTSASPINFTVTFSEAVTDFDDSTDVTLTGTAGATTIAITGGPTIYNVAVSGMTNAGTVIATVPASVALDLASHPNSASTSTDQTVTYIPPTDLSITKTDGVTTATPGGSVTYTITVSNAGPNADPAATVADTFPASLIPTWTCVGAGGGTCTASGSGNINDTVNLPSGGSVTYTATASISASATGSLSNTATVSTSIVDTVPGNNTATDTDTLNPQADLAITKTDGVTTATPGGSVTYTITASNAGPSSAPGATVADTFPASLTATWTCSGAGGGTCAASGSGNINDTVNLPSGGSVTYTVFATISAAATGTLSNTATVTAPGGVTDPTPGNNAATDSDTLNPNADLSITKTDGVTVVAAGGSLTYTITASNAGPSNAPGATVADTFPATLTATWTCSGAGGGTCTASGSGNINDTVNLPVGGSVTYTVSGTVSLLATGTLSNTATVTAPAGVTDPTPGNNSATDTDSVAPNANLSITKTDGVTTATPGGSVTYTITASNAGPSADPSATVADTFPASLTATWTCVGAGGGTCTASGSGNINDTVNLPVGGSVTYTATASISASATGTLSNTATVTASIADTVPGNNTATDTDTLTPQADLSITKTDGVTTATPGGGSVTYTITASNAGPSNAPGTTVADTFPASLTATWTCVGAGGGTCTASGSGNINDTVNLPVGGSVTYTAIASISASATGTLSNTATVTAPAGVTDPTPGNNSATDSDTLTPNADLSITKTDGVTTAAPGGSVTYTITASNAGPSSAPGTTVADTLPASLTATWTCSGAGGGTCTASGSGNISDTVNLPSGGSVTYTVSATISPAATGTLSNTATVTAPAGVTDPTPGNNSATDSDTLAPQADLSITKTDGSTIALAGNGLTYTITASNAGPSNATGSTVADTFPASLTATWTCVGAGGGTCTASGSGNINDVVNLPAGGSVTYTATATLNISATGTLSNTATVTAPSGVTDPTPGNNSATDSDTIVPPVTVTINQAGAQADPTNNGTINFTVVFASAVTGFNAASDVTLGGTAGATTVNITPAGPATTYNVAVTGMTTDGTVTATIPAGVATGSQGESNSASTSTDNTVTYDITAPSVTINQAAGQSDTTSASPVHFTVIFSEAVTGFDGTDVTLSGTANPTTASVTPPSGPATTYDVAVSGMTTSGTITVSIPSGSAKDAADNFNNSSTTTTPGDTDTITNYTYAVAPVITEGASTSVTMSEDGSPTPFALTLHATDANSDPLTWSILSQGSYGTASAAAGPANSSAISYTPLPNYNGTDSFVVEVSDGALTDDITVTVTITPVADLPDLIWNQSYEIKYDTWYGASNPNAYGGNYRKATSGTFAFYPTPSFVKFTWLTYRGPDQGKAQVIVDGVVKATVDLYSATPEWRYKVEVKGLLPGKHSVVIKALNAKNAASSGKWVVVDGFATDGGVFPAAKAVYDDDKINTATLTTSYGSWLGKRSSSTRFGAYRISSAKNATLSFSFDGTSMTWVTARGTTYGKAAIYVDGVLVKTVDLYNAHQQWQYKVAVTGLSYGTHTVVIKVLGTKNPRSTGTGIVCDGFEIE